MHALGYERETCDVLRTHDDEMPTVECRDGI
jgi:hypothetical protein